MFFCYSIVIAAVSALNTTGKSTRGSSYPDYKFAFSVGYSFLPIIVNEWSLRTPMQASKTRENKSIDDEGDDDDDEKFYLYPDT